MAHDTPQTLRSSSIYQVFVRNYSSAGTFDAALPALETASKLGFDIVYLTPIQPSGKSARKGTLGSPYAISDYRAVDPALGGEAGFRRFVDAAHALGLRLIIDVVYNHTSPDSILAHDHPDWFWKGPAGAPAPRFPEWSDVVDLDYSHRELWDYQIETLEQWVRFGVDGFRCDVASLVPVPFWVEARKRIAAIRQCIWLAESVHKEFVAQMRSRGFYAACDAELHEAFDISYDYDARTELEAAWAGTGQLAAYLHHLTLQSCMLPATAIKARFLENHDQIRAAHHFGTGARLRAWTLFAMLLDGAFLAYMGQERAIAHRPSLFDNDPVNWSSGDASFEAWFASAHRATRAIRGREPIFAARELAAGVVLLQRSGGPQPVVSLLNLDGRSGSVDLSIPIKGRDVIGGNRVEFGTALTLSAEPMVIALD